MKTHGGVLLAGLSACALYIMVIARHFGLWPYSVLFYAAVVCYFMAFDLFASQFVSETGWRKNPVKKNAWKPLKSDTSYFLASSVAIVILLLAVTSALVPTIMKKISEERDIVWYHHIAGFLAGMAVMPLVRVAFRKIGHSSCFPRTAGGPCSMENPPASQTSRQARPASSARAVTQACSEKTVSQGRTVRSGEAAVASPRVVYDTDSMARSVVDTGWWTPL